MLCASDRKFSKTFVGDITFDIQRDLTRYPLFLHRNIMRALDHHAKRSRPGSRSSAGEPQNGVSRPTSYTGLVTPPPRSTRLRDQLVEKFHQEDAELIFNVRGIRRKLNYRENLDQRPKKRIKRDVVQCRCYLAVWDNREGHRQLEPILKRSEDCLVIPASTASDAHAVEIELDSPFRISAREFYVPIVSKDGRITKWAVGDKYLLEIKIIPSNTSELWPPVPILSKSEESLTRGLVKRKDPAFTEGMLISNYTNLPHAPAAGLPLNVSFDQGGRTFKTKFGLEVNAEWTYPHFHDAKIRKEQGILVERIREEEKIDPLCRSTENGPSAGNHPSKLRKLSQQSPVKPIAKASYIWDIETRTPVPRESRKGTLEGLRCPICHVHEFSDLKRLQFHFSNSHDKYRFRIEKEERDPQTDDLECVIFRVEVAEIVRPRAANHIKDEREFSWQKPKRPFDIDSYISGDHTWVGALPRRRTAPPQPAPLQATTSSTSTETAGTIGQRSTFRSAAQVLEIPLPSRKKFHVPVAKTMNRTLFYRSINHRAMETGEALSETDDDIDDGWLIKRQHDAVAETERLTQAERRFRQKWNAHVMAEGCPSARYVSDMLVRFVRSNADWMRDADDEVEMVAQFGELTSMLLERNLVSARVVKDCHLILRDGNDAGEKQTLAAADVPNRLPEPAVVAFGVSKGNLGLTTHEKPLQNPGETSEGEKDTRRQAETATHQTPNGTDTSESSRTGKRQATSIPESGSQPELHDPSEQPSTQPAAKRAHRTVANGFCASCNKFIHRPKRNAITCSNLVRSLHFSLLFCSLSLIKSHPVLVNKQETQTVTSMSCLHSLTSLTPLSPDFEASTSHPPSHCPIPHVYHSLSPGKPIPLFPSSDQIIKQACSQRGKFHHLTCLSLSAKLTRNERQAFRCGHCYLKLEAS
jgi:VEFS-Box of polycomb protein